MWEFVCFLCVIILNLTSLGFGLLVELSEDVTLSFGKIWYKNNQLIKRIEIIVSCSPKKENEWQFISAGFNSDSHCLYNCTSQANWFQIKRKLNASSNDVFRSCQIHIKYTFYSQIHWYWIYNVIYSQSINLGHIDPILWIISATILTLKRQMGYWPWRSTLSTTLSISL